jgi:hypothetical protein
MVDREIKNFENWAVLRSLGSEIVLCGGGLIDSERFQNDAVVNCTLQITVQSDFLGMFHKRL